MRILEDFNVIDVLDPKNGVIHQHIQFGQNRISNRICFQLQIVDLKQAQIVIVKRYFF